MSDDPQVRSARGRMPDVRAESPGREALTSSAPMTIYEPRGEPGTKSIPPDARPMHEQPQWRKDFAIDWPRDHYVARRDFTKLLVITSCAFVAGQTWIAAKSLVRSRRAPPARKRIASLAEIAPGSAITFAFPGENDACLLIRTAAGALLAYSQKCTHLSCAVVPKIAEGVIHCPCHEGYFDLETGRNIAGPPPRPLPKVELQVEGDDIYATAVQLRTT